MSKTISQIYNRVINHAISLGIDADQFLSCWRVGDWAGCREFGFEPDIECINEGAIAEKDLTEPVATDAEANTQSNCVKPIDEQVLEALKVLRDALRDHPEYAQLSEEQEEEIGGDTAEFSYLVRVADAAIESAALAKSGC